MAIRTTDAAVRDTIDTDLTSDQVGQYITDASLYVDEQLAASGMSAAMLETVERYLVCHFITLRDPRLRDGAIGSVRESYQRDTQITEYLKAAMALDTTGKIANDFTAKAGKRRVLWRVGDGFDDTEAQT